METHDLLGGKVHVYKRENSRFWQCSTYIAERNWRKSTKAESLAHAKEIAEDWYLDLRGKARAGELKGGKIFDRAADQFEHEYEVITQGERSPKHVKNMKDKLRVHLRPFFGKRVLGEITPGLIQDYRVHRMTSRTHPETGEALRPSRSTLHQEIITLRHVLKTAVRHGWLQSVPDLSPPYKASMKISHRAWFSPQEYKQLYEATRERAANPPKKRWKWECEQLHDFVLFMVNTGLRPDEAGRLEFRDVEIVNDKATDETILEISVRGKRGVGYCKSMPGAVRPFERLKERKRAASAGARESKGGSAGAARELVLPSPTDRLFPGLRHHHLNAVLEEQKLKTDREGLRRSAYSLRHTYICLRLMEGADIYQIAKNCRTSVEMIEKFYAAHIKNMIDAAAVNVRRERLDSAPTNRAANAKRANTPAKTGRPNGRR